MSGLFNGKQIKNGSISAEKLDTPYQPELTAGDRITITAGVISADATPEIAASDKVLTYDSAGLKANLSVAVNGNNIQVLGKDDAVIGEFNVLQSQIIDEVAIEDGYLNITFIVDGDPGKEKVSIDLSEFIDVYKGSEYINVTGDTISFKYDEIHDKLINDGFINDPTLYVTITDPQTITGLKTFDKVNVTGDITLTSGAITARFAPIAIPANANLDDYKTPGMYYCNENTISITLLNTPTPVSFSLFVEKSAGYVQTLTEYGISIPRIFKRNFYRDTWGNWYRVYTTIDPPEIKEVDLLNVVSNVVPLTNLAHDLGSNVKRWKDLYIQNVYAANAIFTHGKTSTDDGKAGIVLGSGSLYINSLGNPGIYFYRSNSTTVTGSIVQAAENILYTENNIRTTAGFQSSYPYAFRLTYGTIGTILYQDANNFHIFKTAPDDPYGAYDTSRPFMMNLTTGKITMEETSIGILKTGNLYTNQNKTAWNDGIEGLSLLNNGNIVSSSNGTPGLYFFREVTGINTSRDYTGWIDNPVNDIIRVQYQLWIGDNPVQNDYTLYVNGSSYFNDTHFASATNNIILPGVSYIGGITYENMGGFTNTSTSSASYHNFYNTKLNSEGYASIGSLGDKLGIFTYSSSQVEKNVNVTPVGELSINSETGIVNITKSLNVLENINVGSIYSTNAIASSGKLSTLDAIDGCVLTSNGLRLHNSTSPRIVFSRGNSSEISVQLVSNLDNRLTITATNGIYLDGSFHPIGTHDLGLTTSRWQNIYAIAADFNDTVTANAFVKIGGTSNQYLMADGSVSTGPSLDLSNYVTLNSNQTITGTKTFTGGIIGNVNNVPIINTGTGNKALMDDGTYQEVSSSGYSGSGNVVNLVEDLMNENGELIFLLGTDVSDNFTLIHNIGNYFVFETSFEYYSIIENIVQKCFSNPSNTSYVFSDIFSSFNDDDKDSLQSFPVVIDLNDYSHRNETISSLIVNDISCSVNFTMLIQVGLMTLCIEFCKQYQTNKWYAINFNGILNYQ